MLSFVADYTVFIWVTSLIVTCVFCHTAKMIKSLTIPVVMVCVCMLVINVLTVSMAITRTFSMYMYCRLLAYVMHTVPVQLIVSVTTKPNLLALVSVALVITSTVIAYVWMGTNILGVHRDCTLVVGEFYVCTPLFIIGTIHTVLTVMCVIWYIPHIMWNKPSLCLLSGLVSLHIVCGLLLSLEISALWYSTHVLFVYLEMIVSCRIFLKLSKKINRDTHCATCDTCQSLSCQACTVCTTYADIYRWWVRISPDTPPAQYIELDADVPTCRPSAHQVISVDDYDLDDIQYNRLEYTSKSHLAHSPDVRRHKWTEIRMFTPLCLTGEWAGCTLTPAELLHFLEHLTSQDTKVSWTNPLSYNTCQELVNTLLRYNEKGSEPMGLSHILTDINCVHAEWLIDQTNAHIINESSLKQLSLISNMDQEVTSDDAPSSSSLPYTIMTTTYEQLMFYLRFCVHYLLMFVDTNMSNTLYKRQVMGSEPCLLLIHVVRSVIANGQCEVSCTRKQVEMMMSFMNRCADSSVYVSPFTKNPLHTPDPMLKQALDTTPVSWLGEWLTRHNREAVLNCGYNSSYHLSAQIMASFGADAQWEQVMNMKESIPYLSHTMLFGYLLSILSKKVVLYRVVLHTGYQQWVPLVSIIQSVIVDTKAAHGISDDEYDDYIRHESSRRSAMWSSRVHSNLHSCTKLKEDLNQNNSVLPSRPYPSSNTSPIANTLILHKGIDYREVGCVKSVKMLNVLLLRVIYILSRGHTDYCFINADLNGFIRSEPHILLPLRLICSVFRSSSLCGMSSGEHAGCSPVVSEIVQTRLFATSAYSPEVQPLHNIHIILNNIWLSHIAGVVNIGDQIDNTLRFVSTNGMRELFANIIHPVCMLVGAYRLSVNSTVNNIFQAMYVYYDELRLAERHQAVGLGIRLIIVWLMCMEYGYNFTRVFRSTLTHANDIYISVLHTRLQTIHRDRALLYRVDRVSTSPDITDCAMQNLSTNTWQVETDLSRESYDLNPPPPCCAITSHQSIDSTPLSVNNMLYS
jgi:hypothetical protein